MDKDELSTGVKLLRRIVIIMGFILFFGTIALFIGVYFKFVHKPAAPTNNYYTMQQPAQVTAIAAPLPEKCAFKPGANVEVPGDIASSSINGNILTIVTGRKTNPIAVNKVQQGNSLTLTANSPTSYQQIVIFDLCQGIVISRINVVATN